MNTVELVNTKQQAELLAVGPDTVRKWASQGIIPCVRVNSRVLRFDPASVRQALEHPGAGRPVE